MSREVTSDYCDPVVAADYACRSELQPPERVIVDRIANDLAGASVLDIGVGCGRTTVHLAPRAGRYVGVDSSAEMISACRKRFADQAVSTSFAQCDVRDLSRFSDEEFNVIVFSYNGLDYVDHAGRATALDEIFRVLRKGGWFLFSSHNTLAVNHLFELTRYLAPSPKQLLRNLRDWAHLRRLYTRRQQREFANAEWSIFIDGARRTYYVHPQVQVRHLEERYDDVTVYGLATGQAFLYSELDGVRDDWLYFLCQK